MPELILLVFGKIYYIIFIYTKSSSTYQLSLVILEVTRKNSIYKGIELLVL